MVVLPHQQRRQLFLRWQWYTVVGGVWCVVCGYWAGPDLELSSVVLAAHRRRCCRSTARERGEVRMRTWLLMSTEYFFCSAVRFVCYRFVLYPYDTA